MRVFVNSREAAGKVAVAALEYCVEVRIVNQSGTAQMFAVEFDERVVMNDEELAEVVKARGY